MPRGERPLDDGDGELLRFAADLRKLRQQAGNPPYRELARVAHYSAATLSEAAGGKKLPTLAVTTAYVRACGGPVDEWTSRWRDMVAEPMQPGVADDAPYLGLAAFQEQDADRFFGREQLVADLLARLDRQRFIGVFGASGAGKSSLLRAGLLPELPSALLLTPTAHPLEECAIQLARTLDTSAVNVRAELKADPHHFDLALRTADEKTVVVVDQFEEVFTLCQGPAERQWFIDALTGTTCRVVLGVRADFYARCLEHEALVAALGDATVAVGPMSADELRRAITQPAQQAGCNVESALLVNLVAATNGQVGTLPLLSHALLETWRRRRGTMLTQAGFEASGGLDGALAQTAQSIFDELDEQQQHVARTLFLRLIAFNDNSPETKRRLDRRELDGEADEVIERFTTARLITTHHDGVELAHEALIHAWPLLRTWIGESRETMRIHRQLTDATAVWETHDRDPGTLYSGMRLAQAQEHLTDILTNRERDFLDASIASETSKQIAARRRTRRLKQLVAVLTALVMLLAGAVVYAVNAERDAARQRNTALALKATDEVTALLSGDPRRAVKVALAARSLASTPETNESLVVASAASGQERVTDVGDPWSAITISPRADVAVTMDSRPEVDGPSGLWSLSGMSAVKTAHLDFDYESLQISANAKVMLVREQGADRIDVWNISDLKNPRKAGSLPGTQEVRTLSEDGRIVLTREKGSAKQMMWDLADPGQPKPIALPNSYPASLRLDGRELVTGRVNPSEGWGGETDAVIDIWRLTEDGRWSLRASLNLGRGWAPLPRYAGDGRFITLDGLDTHVGIWRVPDDIDVEGRELEKWAVIDTESRARTLNLTEDGRFAFTDTAGILRIWDVERRQEPRLVARVHGHGHLLSLTSRGDIQLYDSRMHMWRLDLNADRVMASLCREKPQELTPAEWAQYFLGAPQQHPCALINS